jgi:uncharacterized protein YbcI
MSKKRLYIFIIITISIFLLGYIFKNPIFVYLKGYLSKTEQVKANVLLVEGWLPESAIKKAYEEIQKNDYEIVITTGQDFKTDYYLVSMNGFLIFYLKNNLPKNNTKIDHHIIEVDAYSELDGTYSANFNLYVNGSFIDDYFASKRKRVYTANWEGSLSDSDSIMIQLTNDRMDDYGDVNLYVKDIVIDHKIKIKVQNNTEYDIEDLDGKRRIINNINSCAVLARNSLLSLGVDSANIIAIPGKKGRINRTLSSALAFRDWLQKSNIDIKGINIISMGTHARRTWITYNKILNKKYDIGIISVPDSSNQNSGIRSTIKIIRETLGIIYYWIILIPY